MSQTSDLSSPVASEPASSAPMANYPEAIKDYQALEGIKDVATHLAIKIAASVPNFTTEWMNERLQLAHRTVEEMLWSLKQDHLLEVLGQTGPLSYRYAITKQGIDLSKRLLEICGYVGPTPVTVQQYRDMIESQSVDRSEVTLEKVLTATDQLTLPPEIKEVAALAVASGRSLFMFGPAGNGKSTLGRMLHSVVGGECWIPYGIAVDEQVIRVFDPQVHEQVELDDDTRRHYDRRWVRIRRPMIISGGEMSMDQLDLAFDPSTQFYEAPPHLKANCGTFFIDDLGRQRVDPHDLLNRWIIPLEHQIDYMTLHSGQKIQVPFKMMLIVATNLKTSDVADAAFLRRMGYRIHLLAPTEEHYRIIMRRYAEECGLPIDEQMIDTVINRYRSENRPWRASEPRDLIERCRDICELRGIDYQIDESILNVAWAGYFSDEITIDDVDV